MILVSSNKVEYELRESVTIEYVGNYISGGRVSSAFGRLTAMRRIIKRYNPDIVLSFLTTCNIYTCLATSFGLDVPIVISERNDPIMDCPNKIRRIVRNMSYRLADGYIFQTKDAQKCFGKRIRKNSTVIPNPVKSNLPFADRKNSTKTIVAAGRLTQQKNYPMLLYAFSSFLQDYSEYTLHIYGEGELKDKLIELSNSLNINNNVCFEGLVRDLHDRISKAGMFVLSSNYEGISNSLLEAMAMGLPCISTDCPCGGSRLLIEDGVSGYLTSVDDSVEFCEAMKRVAASKEVADSLGENAKKIRLTHSETNIIKQYFDFMDFVWECNKK